MKLGGIHQFPDGSARCIGVLRSRSRVVFVFEMVHGAGGIYRYRSVVVVDEGA